MREDGSAADRRVGKLGRRPRKERRVLVLTRQSGQSINIGDDVVVTVLEVRGDHVRLGVRAPRHVDVHREEVFEARRLANHSAAPDAREQLADLHAGATDGGDAS
jgi:carbon storage regulator